MYKFINGLSPKIMGEIFQIKENNFNLRTGISFKSCNINTVHYGQNSISYLAPRVWALVPEDIKSISAFKRKIRNWVPVDCPCRLCKRYLPCIGFIWLILFLFNVLYNPLILFKYLSILIIIIRGFVGPDMLISHMT